MTEAEKAARKWIESQMAPTAYLLFTGCKAEAAEELFPEACGRYQGFFAGAAWQAERDANIAKEEKEMRIRLSEERGGEVSDHNRCRAYGAQVVEERIRAQGSEGVFND